MLFFITQGGVNIDGFIMKLYAKLHLKFSKPNVLIKDIHYSASKVCICCLIFEYNAMADREPLERNIFSFPTYFL